MPCEKSWKNEDAFVLLDAISSGMCVDCEDALCITCVKSHKGSKVSMTHHVNDMEVISTLSDEVLTTQTKCPTRPIFLGHQASL
jgi:hypothetical protein